MKIHTAFTGAIAAAMLFTAASASAEPFDRSDNRLDVNTCQLERRIDAGERSGQLTPSESRKLRRELNNLESTIRQVKRDRKVTRKERKIVYNKHDKLSRQITVLSNNREVVRRHDRRHPNDWERHPNDRERYPNEHYDRQP